MNRIRPFRHHPNRVQPALAAALLAALTTTSVVRADGSADFDELPEGFLAYTVQSGGVTFYGAKEFAFDPPSIFVAEDASGYIPNIPDLVDHYSPPNVFGLNGYITGGGYLITRLYEMYMTTGQVENSVRVDVFYKDDPEFDAVEIVLAALLNGEVVGETSFVIDNPRRDVRAIELSLSGIEFDTLRLFGRNQQIPPLSGFLGSIDNLVITGGGPPSDLVLELPESAVPGQDATFTAHWSTPGERVYFAYSLQRGRSEIPNCPGVFAALRRPALLGSAVADAHGDANVTLSVPEGARGHTVFFQAAVPAACTTSNFVPFTFEP